MPNGSETTFFKFLMSLAVVMAALGIEHHHLVAGLFGAVTAVIWMRDLSAKMTVAILIGNVGCAVYFAWTVVAVLHDVFPKYVEVTIRNSNIAAFFLGIGGSFLVQGALNIFQRFGAKPIETLKEIKS